MRCHRSAVVVGVVVGCLVAGCSGQAGEHGGVPATTTGTSAVSTTAGAPTSTTATPTAEAPLTSAPQVDLPPAANAHTEEGAKAFAAYYVKQIDVAARDANTEVLQALADPDCGGCKSVIRLVEGLKRKRQHHSALSFTLAGSFVTPYSTPGVTVIDVLVDDQGATTVDADGRPVVKSPAAKFTLRNSIEWRHATWIVTESVLV